MVFRYSSVAPAAALALLTSFGALAQADFPAVFIANNVSDEISVLRIEQDGSLTFLANHPTSDGPQCIDLTPDGRHLGVGHGTSSSTTEAFQIFRVNADGSLTMLVERQVPDSPLACTWVSDTVIAITETRTSGANHVRMYYFDDKFNTLEQIDFESSGTFNAYLAFDPNRQILFAQSSFGQPYRVFSYRVNANGTIEPASEYITGDVFPLALAPSPDGSRLYSACGISLDRHRVFGFNVSQTGDLAEIPGSPFYSPGNSPAHVAVTDDGNFLFVGHGTDATVRSFTIDQSTGAIEATGHSFLVGSQGSIGDVKTMGDLLFITDETTSGDGIKGVYSFRINADGSFTMIGSIVDPGGVRPERMAVWRGADRVPAQLLDFEFTHGEHRTGTLDDLNAADGHHLVGRSEYGFSAQEANVLELMIDAAAAQGSADLAMHLKARLNNPGGLARSRLYNWIQSRYDQVDSFSIGTADVERTTAGLDGPTYVRANDDRINARYRIAVLATFSPVGFDALFDLVGFSQ